MRDVCLILVTEELLSVLLIHVVYLEKDDILKVEVQRSQLQVDRRDFFTKDLSLLFVTIAKAFIHFLSVHYFVLLVMIHNLGVR